MASNIVPGNINGDYPVAGQDNSSQGFRDNFTGIRNNFTEAKTEIEELQSNKANLNASNNFSGNTVSNAVLKDNSETVYNHGTVSSGTMTLNHENGHYQTATITTDTTFSFINFPSNSLGRIILDLTINSGANDLVFPSALIKADNVTGSAGSSDTITPGFTGRVLYEFMSSNGGTTVLMHQLGKQYA
jgi:hypothetical protein